jgi:hypothetical protein
MSNVLLTPSVIAREALMILQNNIVASDLVYRDVASEFTGAKVGDTITVRRPASFTANEFTSSVSVQNISEGNTTLQLEKHFDVSFEVTSKELSLSLEDFSTQILQPAVIAMAQGVDSYLLSKYVEINQFVGTAGDAPDSLADLALVDKALNDAQVPLIGRNAVVNTQAKADMMGIEAIVRADARGDAGTALREASMGRVMGLDWYMSQNVKSHTAGVPGGTPTATGTAGAFSITVASGGAAGTFKKGDVFTVAGDTRQYVVTADATLNGSGAGTVSVYPALATSPSGAAITLVGNHAANLAFHRNAFQLAVVPLALPMGAAQAEYISYRGMGIRVVYDYNSTAKKDVVSLDLLCGAKAAQPELAVRVLG